jgi:hypothetical protein
MCPEKATAFKEAQVMDIWMTEDVAEALKESDMEFMQLTSKMQRVLHKVWFKSHQRALTNAARVQRGENIYEH